jgi:hypothetical protein
MDNKINIEEIKYLIPDYITGSLSQEEAKLAEEAIAKYPEINSLYNEMKAAFEITKNVKYEEPAPQYWNNLLPKIHQKIEERETSGVKNPFAVIWKILVPVAAVILLFLVYQIYFNTSDNNVNNKILVKTDSVKQQYNIKKDKTPVIKEDNKQTVESVNVKPQKKNKIRISKQDNVNVPEEKRDMEVPDKENMIELQEQDNDDFASLESLILGAGEKGTLDSDIEDDLQNLSNNEKDKLLEQLEKTNL